MESCRATWTPELAFVAPGARVTIQMPGAAGQLSVGFRHHGRAAFLTAHDERHAVAAIVERVQNSQIALARNAEDHSGSMQMKLIGQNFSPGSQSRLRHSASGAFFRSS